LAKVQALSETIQAHYAWMESELGKQKLAQLYQLLDAVIQLEPADYRVPEVILE
jgi:glutamate synthase domain-containing protein 3